jgi:hypothetical protein
LALLEDIAGHIKDGKCVLFLGAGVHAPAPAGSKWNYPAQIAPPFGGDLSEKLAAESGYSATYSKASPRELPRVAMYYELKEGNNKEALVNRVRREVEDGKTPSPILQALGELNFPLVVTTNYDTFFERSLPRSKDLQVRIYEKTPNAEAPTPDFNSLSQERPGLLKIHGDFNHPESVVITDEDYIDFVLRMSEPRLKFHPFPLTALYLIQKCPTLFLGYSLLDYNIRLFLKTLRFKADQANYPVGYSIDRYPDYMVQKVWQDGLRWVWFVPEDVWSFVPALYQILTGKPMP